MLCACGCGEEIEPQPHHKYQPARYKPGHYQRLGLSHLGKRYSKKRIQPGTLCACGCGESVPEYTESGAPRFAKTTDGRFYIHGHQQRTRKAERNPVWKGGRLISYAGYVRLYRPESHDADKKGYVFEHRLVWEGANGRLLRHDEDVHHVNGIKDDNRPENLVALTRSQHLKTHGTNPNARATKDQLREAQRKATASRLANKSAP